MLSRTKESQMDKARNTMRDFVKYTQEIARDERLRADMRAALDHGSTASQRFKKDVQAGGIYTKLAADKKLRKNLRAMLDDLDDAGNRMRRKSSHRVRNAVLVLVGAVTAALAFPRAQQWLRKRTSDMVGTGSGETEPLM
jgi:hypothetical protein